MCSKCCTGVYVLDKAPIINLKCHILHHFKDNELFCNILK